MTESYSYPKQQADLLISNAVLIVAGWHQGGLSLSTSWGRSCNLSPCKLFGLETGKTPSIKRGNKWVICTTKNRHREAKLNQMITFNNMFYMFFLSFGFFFFFIFNLTVKIYNANIFLQKFIISLNINWGSYQEIVYKNSFSEKNSPAH